MLHGNCRKYGGDGYIKEEGWYEEGEHKGPFKYDVNKY